jgi:hypothetical protein
MNWCSWAMSKHKEPSRKLLWEGYSFPPTSDKPLSTFTISIPQSTISLTLLPLVHLRGAVLSGRRRRSQPFVVPKKRKKEERPHTKPCGFFIPLDVFFLTSVFEYAYAAVSIINFPIFILKSTQLGCMSYMLLWSRRLTASNTCYSLGMASQVNTYCCTEWIQRINGVLHN